MRTLQDEIDDYQRTADNNWLASHYGVSFSVHIFGTKLTMTLIAGVQLRDAVRGDGQLRAAVPLHRLVQRPRRHRQVHRHGVRRPLHQRGPLHQQQLL